jgi:hypothetical protein
MPFYANVNSIDKMFETKYGVGKGTPHPRRASSALAVVHI